MINVNYSVEVFHNYTNKYGSYYNDNTCYIDFSETFEDCNKDENKFAMELFKTIDHEIFHAFVSQEEPIYSESDDKRTFSFESAGHSFSKDCFEEELYAEVFSGVGQIIYWQTFLERKAKHSNQSNFLERKAFMQAKKWIQQRSK